MRTLPILSSCSFLFCFVQACASPSLTIYNDHFAVVRDAWHVDLKAGHNELRYSHATAHLQPNSVIFRDPEGEAQFKILEQNYRNDPVSITRMLEWHKGAIIEFEVKDPDRVRLLQGRIIRPGMDSQQLTRYQQRGGGIAHHSNQPIIEVDGKWQFGLPGKPLFPALKNDAVLEPTLIWSVHAPEPASFDAELSYISQGFGWEADYNIVMSDDADRMNLTAWITANNFSGANFRNAQLKLIAGDVHRVHKQVNVKQMRFTQSIADSEIKEKSFDDYHMYELPRKVDLHDGESKQIEFLRSAKVKGRTVYEFTGGGSFPQYSSQPLFQRHYPSTQNTKIGIFRVFENSESNGLGVALPKGTVRFYKKDADDGQLEFVGENRIDHTTKNETIKLYTGNAFDIVGERVQTDFKYESRQQWMTEDFEIEIRNRKDESVEINVLESLKRWSNWTIETKSQNFEKLNHNTIVFKLQIPAESTKTLSYRVRYTW